MVMFRVYYFGLAPYENAPHFLGSERAKLGELSEEIYRRCGAELLRRRMSPRESISQRRLAADRTPERGAYEEGRVFRNVDHGRFEKATIRAQRQDLRPHNREMRRRSCE